MLKFFPWPSVAPISQKMICALKKASRSSVGNVASLKDFHDVYDAGSVQVPLDSRLVLPG